jgi:membrane protease YdiL (CAAX protease family)
MKDPTAQKLAEALKAVYRGGRDSLPADRAQAVKAVLQEQIPSSWYQDRVLESLYRKTNDKAELEKLEQRTGPSAFSLFCKMLGLAVFGGLSLLVGVVVIFVQLLFVARNARAADESDKVKAPAHSSFATIYGVFIGWVTTQLMIGSLAQNAMKSISPLLKMSSNMEPGSNKPVLIALTVAALYLLSNAPGTLYAYLFSLRPAKISFFEGFRLRNRVGKNGPISLVMAGILTWFAAVPLVLLSTFIGYNLGSQGSSNPIIALVMEAARSGNWLSTILFYLTLGVLAPLCEETLFRGFLYANLRRRMGVFPSMLISAGLFAAFHLDLGAFLPLFSLGCLFALVFEKTKSILPSMVAHGLWNSGTFTLLLLLFGS